MSSAIRPTQSSCSQAQFSNGCSHQVHVKPINVFLTVLALQALAAATEQPPLDDTILDGFDIPAKWHKMDVEDLKDMAVQVGAECAEGIVPQQLAQRDTLFLFDSNLLKEAARNSRPCAGSTDLEQEAEKRALAACKLYDRVRAYTWARLSHPKPSKIHAQYR